MKSIYHFISQEESVKRRLCMRLAKCKMARLASAFFTNGAFLSLEPSLKTALANGAVITFLLGRFDFVTEPKAVRGLLNLSNTYPDQLLVYFDADYKFHYKLAIFKADEKQTVIIGSSNLTPKGLQSIGEVNLEIVNNQSVYKQADDTLKQRLKTAVPASQSIDEYTKKYNRAKKLRKIKARWDKNGSKTWRSTSVKTPPQPPEGNSFIFCWVREPEPDYVLRNNIDLARKTARQEDVSLPNQWVHLDSDAEYRLYKADLTFVLIDRFDNSLGFAHCIKKVKVLDEHEHLEPVIFYKYLYGWKAKYSSREELNRQIVRLRLNYAGTKIKLILSKRLKTYLTQRRKRR
jgi:HKD family nuclease